jgi:hypothetical protein
MLHYAIPCFELAVDQPTRYRSTYPQFVADCERGRRHAHVRLPSHGPSAGHRKYLVVDEAVSLFLDFVILYYEQFITGTTRYFYFNFFPQVPVWNREYVLPWFFPKIKAKECSLFVVCPCRASKCVSSRFKVEDTNTLSRAVR